MKRKYELKERAKRQAETRQRIVEAAVGLHSTIGPARTTVKAIAENARVERHTVYAHFPDDEALFAACTSHWAEQHPFPDLQDALSVDDPQERLRRVLTEIYGWYEEVESDLIVFSRDASVVPAAAADLERYAAQTAEIVSALGRGRPRRKTVRAALGHAAGFETWRSLVRQEGLSGRQAADAMVRFVASQ